jgi:ABC-type transporter Mla subunit MlaD
MRWHLELDGDDADMANVGGIYFWTQRDFNALMGQLGAMQAAITGLQKSMNQLLTQENQQMAALDDLTTQVAQNTNLEQSAIQLIQGIAKQLQDAVANNDSAALTNLAAQLNTSAAALGAAIAANTQVNPLKP